MKPAAVFLVFVLTSWTVLAQTAPQSSQPAAAEARRRIIRVVHVHGDAGTLANLAAEGSGVFYQISNPLHLVVLKGAPPDVDAVEHTIQQLDSSFSDSSKNVELMVFVLAGSMDPLPGSSLEAAGLDSVIRQLRAVFPYRHYELMNTMLLRASQGSEADASGMMRRLSNIQDANAPSPYNIHIKSASVSGQQPATVHLADFTFEAHLPVVSKSAAGNQSYATGSVSQVRVSIKTDLDVKPGERVVVANSNVEDAGISLFLVLTAQLVD